MLRPLMRAPAGIVASSTAQHHPKPAATISQALSSRRAARSRTTTVMAATPTTQKEKVWDYPRPPRLEPTSRHLIVKLGDTVIADTTQAYRVLETSHPPTYYLPPADCKQEFFSASSKPRTLCEWKGRASYHDVTAGGQVATARVWSYSSPTAPFAPIKDYYCFYASPFTCTVDGETVQAQPGDFYGGWITSDIEGPFKGAPGTMGW